MQRLIKVAMGQLDMMEMLESVAEMTDATSVPEGNGQVGSGGLKGK